VDSSKPTLFLCLTELISKGFEVKTQLEEILGISEKEKQKPE